MIQIVCITQRETVSYLPYVYDLDYVYQEEGNSIISTICLLSRFCISERGKPYHTYSMFMIQIVCITQRETVLYLPYVYDLDYVYQKEGNCIISTVCLLSRFCVSERGKLYHTYSMFMIQIMCITKRETESYIQYVYNLELLYQKQRNCVMPTV